MQSREPPHAAAAGLPALFPPPSPAPQVTMCAESRRSIVFGLHDDSITYCTLHNLFCGADERCASVGEVEFEYSEAFGRRDDAARRLASPPKARARRSP